MFHRYYGNFIGGSASAWTWSFAAYIGFVNFDDAGKLLKECVIVTHSDSNPMCHIPCTLVAPKFQDTLKLLRGNSLLCRANQIDGKEPLRQWNMRVVEDA